MIKAGNREGPPGGITFELGVRRLTARTQAGRNQGGKRQLFRSGPGRACIGRKAVMSSIRWFPQGALDLEGPLSAKTRSGSEAQASAPPGSWAGRDHRPA